MSDEKTDPVFQEAFERSFIKKSNDKQEIDETVAVVVSQTELALNAVENPVDEWSKVKEAMEGRFATRFIQTMDNLGDKEFNRVYLKAIEYFKPKITRSEPSTNIIEDNTINVNIMVINKETGEVEKIKVD